MSNNGVLRINTPKWALPLLAEDARYRDAHGGRGSGKSHFFAEMMIERCVRQTTHAVCLREVQKSIKHSVKKLLEIKIEQLGVGHLFEVQEQVIKSKHNGSIILFQGLQNHTSDSIKSFESFDVFWIEEAQSVSQKSLDILRPTVRKPGSEIWTTWNPSSPDDPIEFIRSDNPPPRTISVEVNYHDNPWFNETELVNEMQYDRKRDIDRYNHVWLGQHEQNSEARVFKNWIVDEFETDKDADFRFGADFGYAVDPTVLIRGYLSGRKLYIDYEACKYSCEIINLPELFGTVPESDVYPIVADSSRPETISHLQKHGYPNIFKSVKGKNSIKEGIEWLKSYNIVVHPRCKSTIKELASYSYKVDSATDKVTSKFKDEDNHVIDALRYAFEAVRRKEKKETPTIVVPPTKNFWG